MKAKGVQLKYRISIILFVLLLISYMVVFTLFSVVYIRGQKNAVTNATEVTIRSLLDAVSLYVEELNNITILPYVNTNLMRAIRRSVSHDKDQNISQYENTQFIETEFKRYLQLSGSPFENFMLITINHKYMYSGKEGYPYFDARYNFENAAWYQEIEAADGKAVFIGKHFQDYMEPGHANHVFTVGRVIKTTYGGEKLGIIFADGNIDRLSSLLSGTSLNKDVSLILLDSSGKEICSNTSLNEAELDNILRGNHFRYTTLEVPLETTGWKLVGIIEERQLFFNNRNLLGVLVLMLGFSILFMMGSFIVVSTRIFAPLQRLTETMKQVEETGVSVRCDIQSTDEIGVLSGSFNHMMDEIQEYVIKEKESAELLNKAEYSALQSQIEPHFIYNVLNNFAGLNRNGETSLLDESIHALAQYMRYLLSSNEYVTLSKEIEMSDRYCDLMKLRFGDRLETIFSCDKEYHNVLIPRLLLQPLVENAILHGIEPSENGGYISIICEQQDGNLQISVSDNGIGFDTDTGFEEGIGLSNVRKRLALAYKSAALTVDSSPGNGTDIVIRIPDKELFYEDHNR